MSPSVTIKPRPLPTRGWRSLWQWLVNAITTPDSEILKSSGMDAIVMIKGLAIGVQLFTPLAIVGCVLLIPLHYTQRSALYDGEANVNTSQLMGLTIAALPQQSPIMWCVCVFLFCFVLCLCVLLCFVCT